MCIRWYKLIQSDWFDAIRMYSLKWLNFGGGSHVCDVLCSPHFFLCHSSRLATLCHVCSIWNDELPDCRIVTVQPKGSIYGRYILINIKWLKKLTTGSIYILGLSPARVYLYIYFILIIERADCVSLDTNCSSLKRNQGRLSWATSCGQLWLLPFTWSFPFLDQLEWGRERALQI